MVVSREITFQVGPFEMAGQLDLPHAEDDFPTVFLVPGSPSHDRHGNVRGYPGYNNYFAIISQVVIQSGYAVFRYDKGGTGKSSSGLSAASDVIAAYRACANQADVDRSQLTILAIGGGSAHIYRKWLDLEQINPVKSMLLMSTGVNDFKLQDFALPIGVIGGEGYVMRSKVALDRYAERTGQVTMAYEVMGANEQLCHNDNNQASLFKEGGCQLHNEALEAISKWLGIIRV